MLKNSMKKIINPFQPRFLLGCLRDNPQQLLEIAFLVPTLFPCPREKKNSGSPDTIFLIDSSTTPTKLTLGFLSLLCWSGWF